MAQELTSKIDMSVAPPQEPEWLTRYRCWVNWTGELLWPEGEPSKEISIEQREQCLALAGEYLLKSVAAEPKLMAPVLHQLDSVMPSKQLDEKGQTARWAAYFEDLANVPLDSLVAACRAWRRDPSNTFFPTPGQLLERCTTTNNRVLQAARFEALAQWEPGEKVFVVVRGQRAERSGVAAPRRVPAYLVRTAAFE